jgi:hypothetical protein
VIGKLRVGNTQTFVFRQSDSGPFWPSDQDKEEQWLDKVITGRTKKKVEER